MLQLEIVIKEYEKTYLEGSGVERVRLYLKDMLIKIRKLCNKFHLKNKLIDQKYNKVLEYIKYNPVDKRAIKLSQSYIKECIKVADKYKNDVKQDLDSSNKYNNESIILTVLIGSAKIYALYISLVIIITLLRNIIELVTFASSKVFFTIGFKIFVKVYDYIFKTLLKIKDEKDIDKIKKEFDFMNKNVNRLNQLIRKMEKRVYGS